MDSSGSRRTTEIKLAFLLFAVWLVAIFLVNPIGEFPLNDDWSYARSVKTLIERGDLEFTGWVSMPLLFQVFWGAVFSVFDGFSFTALRFSTIALAFMAIFGTFSLLKSISGSNALSFFGATLLLSNPVFFSLSNTFMTDVPFTAMFVTSTALLITGVRRDSFYLIAAGLIIGIFALFIRQLGLALFIGFAVGYLSRNGFSPKRVALAIAPLFVALILYVGYGVFLEHIDKLPRLYGAKSSALLHKFQSLSIIKTIAMNSFKVMVYLGLFILPFMLCLFFSRATGSRNFKLIVSAGLAALGVAGFIAFRGNSFPLAGNILFKVGCGTPQFAVGPVTLRDIHVLCMKSAPSIPQWLQISLLFLGSAAGAVGAFLLLRIEVSPAQILNKKFLATNWEKLMLVSMTAAYLMPIVVGGFFDRYLIPIFPIVMASILSEKRHGYSIKLSAVPAVALLVLSLGFSIVATHDYLAWNRSRWIGLSFLEGEIRASSLEVDGGFEYNGWVNYSDSYKREEGKSWWWVYDDLYMISFHKLDGYRVLKSFPINTWMPGGKDDLLILKRND